MTSAGLIIGRREDFETGLLSGLVNGDVDSSLGNRQGPPDVAQVEEAVSIKVERVSESDDIDNDDNVVTGRLSDVLAAEISNNDNARTETDLGAAVNVVHVSQLNDDISNDDNVEDNDFATDSDWESRPLRSRRRREPKKRCEDCGE